MHWLLDVAAGASALTIVLACAWAAVRWHGEEVEDEQGQGEDND